MQQRRPIQESFRFIVAAGAAGLLAGVMLANPGAALPILPRVADLQPEGDLAPFPGLGHVGMLVASREAQARLDEGRPWAAWTAVRDLADGDPNELPPELALVAARAAAGWEGWSHVRRLLQGRSWLDEEDDGRGLLLLAQAAEAQHDWAAAADAYGRYAGHAGGSERGTAHAHQAAALRRGERPREAAVAWGQAAAALPEIADWMLAMRTDALAASGDPAAVASPPAGSSASRAAAARAEARYWAGRDDHAAAARRLLAEASALEMEDPALSAELVVEAAREPGGAARPASLRGMLWRALADERALPPTRAQAASLFRELYGERTRSEELARASAYEAARKPGLAARALRDAFSGDEADGASALRIARLLFAAADYEPAASWAQRAASRLRGDAAADAELVAARVLVRRGRADEGAAALARVAERYPSSSAAGSALFLLGDAAANRDAAIAYYRRSAAVTASPDAREALFRVGDRCLRAGDKVCAIQAWEAYAVRWPRGEQGAEAAYQAGVLRERAGQPDAARTMYGAAIAAEPTSYFAVRAADHLGADPLAAALTVRDDGLDGGEADGVIRRLAALEAAGLEAARQAELQAQMRRLQSRPGARLRIAEAVRDGGHAREGIALGRALLEEREGAWSDRLLRLVFPLPYQQVLLDEADDAGIDPWLLAGLVRQESSFDPGARSWVGAAGLSQIMPGTGAWLAPGAGVRNFSPELLTVPEINLRMGARYLRDQVRRYHGARDLALAAYNAGPARADRWKRELGYGGDPDAFRERIPFAETRGYVKVVIRNAEVYRRLYGGGRSPGLVDPAR